jgi:Glucose / Sorbosone dehydrogenase
MTRNSLFVSSTMSSLHWRLAVDTARALFLVMLTLPAWVPVGSVPEGFIVETVTNTKAITGTFAPNPRNGNKPMLILVEKKGLVSILEDPDNSPFSITVLDLGKRGTGMCTNGERGLQNIVLHPQFETNRFVYLYYNLFKEGCLADFGNNGPWNVIARFVMNAETLELDFNSRKEIWRYVKTTVVCLLLPIL